VVACLHIARQKQHSAAGIGLRAFYGALLAFSSFTAMLTATKGVQAGNDKPATICPYLWEAALSDANQFDA